MNGKEFMKMLHDEHGLLEGCRLADEYLEIWEEGSQDDPEEKQFCEELKVALNELNNL